MSSIKWLKTALLALLLVSVALIGTLASSNRPVGADDLSAGKSTYDKNCQGCHAANGAGAVGPALNKQMSNDTIISHVRNGAGIMPAFPAAAISDAQLQDLIAYIVSLSAAPKPDSNAAEAPKGPIDVPGKLSLGLPEKGIAGKNVSVQATLKKDNGDPISGARVQLLEDTQFFTQGQMVLDESTTDSHGVATFAYDPRQPGTVKLTARYTSDGVKPISEATADINVTKTGNLYIVQAGIKMPAPGPQLALPLSGSQTYQVSVGGPGKVLRLPGGSMSWLMLFVLVLGSVWTTYFFVLYQTFRISREPPQPDHLGQGLFRTAVGIKVGKLGRRFDSLVPTLAMVAIVMIAVTLITVILSGPSTHLSMLP